MRKTPFCIHADPIATRVGTNVVYCLGKDLLHLSASESKEFIQSLNDFVQPQQLYFTIGTQPDEWYCYAKTKPKIKTVALKKILNRNLLAYFPQGKEAAEWNRLLTEIQMSLHQH